MKREAGLWAKEVADRERAYESSDEPSSASYERRNRGVIVGRLPFVAFAGHLMVDRKTVASLKVGQRGYWLQLVVDQREGAAVHDSASKSHSTDVQDARPRSSSIGHGSPSC